MCVCVSARARVCYVQTALFVGTLSCGRRLIARHTCTWTSGTATSLASQTITVKKNTPLNVYYIREKFFPF